MPELERIALLRLSDCCKSPWEWAF